MNAWIELLLALLQGLTEPLPISSSGHLVVAQAWLGIGSPSVAFASFVNLGSVLGVVAYYRVIIVDLVRDAFQGIQHKTTNSSIRYILQVAVATLPAGLIGLVVADVIASFDGVRIVGAMLLVTGALLVLISRTMTTTPKELTWLDAWLVGVAQALALIPGLSRSGLTTIAGLARGIEFDKALQFSLMMYLPISIAAGGWSVLQSTEPLTLSVHSFLGLLVAASSTYVVIGVYRRLVAQRKLLWFAAYCLIAGLLVVVVG
jgi:undecaprenyl-diphosphatase